MTEEYRDIIGYEGIYQISNEGNLKSLKWNKSKILKKHIDNNGYYSSNLTLNNKYKTFRLHMLVAKAFLNHTPDGTTKLVVNHIDGNKLNNNINNLEVVTHRENITTCSKTRGNNFSSNYKGVSYYKPTGKWKATVTFNKKSIHLGYFYNELDAHLAFLEKFNELNKINK